jgi:hypothetical protein
MLIAEMNVLLYFSILYFIRGKVNLSFIASFYYTYIRNLPHFVTFRAQIKNNFTESKPKKGQLSIA